MEAARTALATTRSRSAVLEKAWAAAAEQARVEQVGCGRLTTRVAECCAPGCAPLLTRPALTACHGQSGWNAASCCNRPRLDLPQEARLEAQAQLEWTQKHVRELSAELAHAQVR